MAMNGMQRNQVAEQLARRVVGAVRNPDEWKTALRVEIERLRLDVIRIDLSGSMFIAAYHVVEEADKHGRTATDINP